MICHRANEKKDIPPSTAGFRCVEAKYTATGKWQWIWNDKGSGANDDVSVYQLQFRLTPKDRELLLWVLIRIGLYSIRTESFQDSVHNCNIFNTTVFTVASLENQPKGMRLKILCICTMTGRY